MATSELTLGSLANLLFVEPTTRKVVCITAPETGNPALMAMDLTLTRQFISLQYEDPNEIDALVDEHAGSVDVVISDPFHTYESSVGCYERSLRLLRPGGLLLSHDCMPLPEHVSIDRLEGAWSGVSFAAFRDHMMCSSVPWCTLAADHGIGIAVAGTQVERDVSGALHNRWSAEEHDSYLTEYVADPYGLMRGVQAEHWREAVARLGSGRPLTDLMATFTDWDDLLSIDEYRHREYVRAQASAPTTVVGRALRRLRRAAGRRAPRRRP